MTLVKMAQDAKPTSQWDAVKHSFANSIKGMFPIEGRKNKIEVGDITFDETAISAGDIKAQEKAKHEEKTWGVPVFAEFHLKDKNTGQIINKTKIKLAVMPKLTDRYTYLVDGSEWNSAYQWRLKSGIYSKIKENGKHETEFNLQKQFAREARIYIPFDDEKQKFTFKYATNNLPLYSVLKALDVPDEKMKEVWGEQLYKSNIAKDWKKDITKFYKNKLKKRGIVAQSEDDFEHIKTAVKDAFHQAEVNPDTTKLTLGKSHNKLTGDALLDGSVHIWQVSRGEKKPDDVYALYFKHLLGIDDFISEKFGSSKTAINIRSKIKSTLDKRDKISQIIPNDLFSKPLKQVFVGNTLSQRPDQSNPLDILSSASITSIQGPGGISSSHAIRMPMKIISQSNLGFLDVIHTPEGETTGITLHLPVGVVKQGREAKLHVYNLKEKKFELVNPAQLHSETFVMPDEVSFEKGKPKFVSDHVTVMDPVTHEFKKAPVSSAKYVIPSTKYLFDEATNMIPFLQNNQGNRTMTGAKQPTQGVPLVNREAPLVQVLSTKPGQSFEALFGKKFSHSAPVDGEVVDIKKDKLGYAEEIHIKQSNGTIGAVQLYNHFPLNDKKSFIHAEPIVKIGDKVTKGQLLAHTNHTDKNGELAVGTNLKIGYFALGNQTFEDSIVISESAAKKLTSEHLHKISHELDKDNDHVSLSKYLAHITTVGKAIHKSKLANLDENGVVKPGSIVKPGDLLIAAVSKNTAASQLSMFGTKVKGAVTPFRDKALVWENDYPGEVVKVIKKPGEKGYSVYVKTQEQAVIGDKLTARHGDKGIIGTILPDHEMPRTEDGQPLDMISNPSGIACHDDKTEILTRARGWISFKDLKMEDEIATCNPYTLELEWQFPEEIFEYDYEGKMWNLETEQLNFCVTSNHRMWVGSRKKKPQGKFNLNTYREFFTETAQESFGKIRRMLKVTNWIGQAPEFVIIPQGTKGRSGKCSPEVKIPSILWAEFLGWFVSEGSTYTNNKGRYRVTISQSREANLEKYEKICTLVSSMGFKHSKEKSNITILHKGLYETLLPLGKCDKKYIPQDVLNYPKTHLKKLFDAYIQGDGHIEYEKDGGYKGTRGITTSKQLADNLQEIAIKLGLACNIKTVKRSDYKNGVVYSSSYSYSKGAPWINIKKLPKKHKNEWIDYKGKVYCATVPNGLIITRRYNTPLISHNSRINIGQVLETAASKIARKTGKPYIVDNFPPEKINYPEKIKKDLEAHGLKDTEKVFDPKLNKWLDHEPLVGEKYIIKMRHQIEKKHSVRGMDSQKYTINLSPKGGGDTGAQAIGQLEFYALLGHGARQNLKEISTYKADKQVDDKLQDTDFWTRVQLGIPLPPPRPTFAYRKFESMLTGLGINLEKKGNEVVLQPLTDKGVLKMSNGEVKNAFQVRGKDGAEMPGGLFDPKITGGIPNGPGKGQLYSHIHLAEPFPSPVFIGTRTLPGPAVVLSGLKFGEFEQVVKGEKNIDVNGKTLTGGHAIQELLKKVDIHKELQSTVAKLPKLSGAELNKENRKAKYLKALSELKLRPEEAYMMNYVPVIPPVFRPIVPMEDGQVRHSDVTELYKQLILANNRLKDKEANKYMPDVEQKIRAETYDILKATMGIGTIPTYDGNRKIKGLLQSIAGDSPKMGFFQDKLMKRRQELSMRSTIVPATDIGIDELGLPKHSALELYKPFVIRELVRRGMDLLEAKKEVKEQSDIVWKALDSVTKERPVLLKRDPVLHKYNIMAFYPKLVEGSAIQLHGLNCGAYNADHDGDTMAVYLPLTEEAKREAIDKMLPSKNLFSSTNYGILHAPEQEAVLGLHLLTKWGDKKHDTIFDNKQQILNNKNLKDDDVVSLRINGKLKETTKGRLKIADLLPDKFRSEAILHDPSFSFKKKNIHELLEDVAKEHSHEYPRIVNSLRNLGSYKANSSGFSFTLNDLVAPSHIRDRILEPYKKEEEKIRASSLSQDEKDQKIVELYTKATDHLDKEIHHHLQEKGDNNIFTMVKTKARGSDASLRQMLIAPMLLVDAQNKIVPNPVLRSYSEGLDLAGYWTALHGARKGTIQRAQGTSVPGAMAKEMINLNLSTLVTKHDCNTTEGQHMHLKDHTGKDEVDVTDRFLAEDTHTYKKGTLITPEVFNVLKDTGHTDIKVRSPLHCALPKGVCSKCFGINEVGKLHEVGTNIGVIASQALSEPVTQLAMDCGLGSTKVLIRINDGLDTKIERISLENLFNTY